MSVHWTDYPAHVENFGDLLSVLESLDRDNSDDAFTAESFGIESDEAAYTVDPLPGGYRFTPRLDRMPGLERLLDRPGVEGYAELTPTQVRDLHRQAMRALGLGRAAVDAMTFAAVADLLDSAAGAAPSVAPPSQAPSPSCSTRILGDLLVELRCVEQAATATRAEADAMNGAPGTGYLRIQAAVFEACAEYKKHPAFPHLEAYVNQHFGEFTYTNLLRVRGDVCRARSCGTIEADQLPVEVAAATLRCPGMADPDPPTPPHAVRRVNIRPDSIEPPRHLVEAAMRALPGELNTTSQPQGSRDPAGRRGGARRLPVAASGPHSSPRDATEWAIYAHAEARRLEPSPGLTTTPGVVQGGEWVVRPATSATYGRDQCVVWADQSLWQWWAAISRPPENDRPNQVDAPMPTELPTPFTVAEPNWTLGDASIPPVEHLPQTWTLGAVLQLLRAFAGRYADPRPFVVPPGGSVALTGELARAAIVLSYRRALCSVPGYDDLQTEVLLRYDAAVSVKSVGRLLADVIRGSGGSVTVSQAEQLDVREALRRLKATPVGAEGGRGVPPAKPDKPARNEGGRPRLGEGPRSTPAEKALRNIYDLIRGAWQEGSGAKTLLDHFRTDKDFKERVREAGKAFDEQLFRNALAWIKENPDQETRSGNVF